jgi:phenylalanyl-tRNA synthetase alpha chain
MNDLDALVDSARSGFEAATTPSELENAKARFLGKSGRLTEMMKGLSALGVEDKKIRGAAINQAKQAIEGALGCAPHGPCGP